MPKTEKNISKKAEPVTELKTIQPSRALSPFDEMDRWFESVFPRGWMQPIRREWPLWSEPAAGLEIRTPRVDVIDRDDEVVVRAEVPGLEKDDLEVSVSDSTVTIKGQTRREEKEEKGDFYRHEISRGAFARTVMLPHEVDMEGSKAKFKDGVLELTLPKVEKAKRRTITID